MINIYHKLSLNQNFKAVLNYCFRVLIFLLLSRNFILEPLANILLVLLPKTMDFGDFVIIGFFIIFYSLQKICGLFKKLDNLNFFLAVIIILLVDLSFIYSHALKIQLIPLRFSFGRPDFIFILIWFFFIYKFLNLLTRIFPVPFKQIGYIFSIDLVKDIYRDVKKDIQENYLKK